MQMQITVASVCPSPLEALVTQQDIQHQILTYLTLCPLCLAFPSSSAQSKVKTQSLSILTTQHTQALTALLSKSSRALKLENLGDPCSNSHPQQGSGAQNAGDGLVANSTKSRARPSFLLCMGSKDRLSFATTQQKCCSHSWNDEGWKRPLAPSSPTIHSAMSVSFPVYEEAPVAQTTLKLHHLPGKAAGSTSLCSCLLQL